MNSVEICVLQNNEVAPLALLLLADPSIQKVKTYLPAGYCYVAKNQDGATVGVYVLLPVTTDVVELVNVAVAENQQRKGVGKLLVEHAIENARLRGYAAIEVGTGNSSVNQLALYQKCGFSITSSDKDYFVRNYPEAIFENGIQCRDMIRLLLKL